MVTNMMLVASNYNTVQFQGQSKWKKPDPNQIKMDFSNPDQVVLSNVDDKVDIKKMSPLEQERYVKKQFKKLAETDGFNSKNGMLEELCKIDSTFVGNELKALYLKSPKKNKFKIYILDAGISRKLPKLKGKFITLATSDNDTERKQILNELVNDKSQGIGYGLVEVLDFIPAKDQFGINILDGIAERLDPAYKGYCRLLASPIIDLSEKNKILKKINMDERPQAERIQVYLLKFLRPFAENKLDVTPDNKKSYQYTSLRIDIINNLANRDIIDASPDKILIRKLKIKDAILSEFKNGKNPNVLRITALNTLASMPDSDRYIYNSVKNYVIALENSENKSYQDSFGMRLSLAAAKEYLVQHA